MPAKAKSNPGKSPVGAKRSPNGGGADAIAIRPVRTTDIAQVIAIDERVTGLAKPTYWKDAYERYGKHRPREGFFFVATPADQRTGRILGFIIGEIRAWEFGSAPCGWVFAISVDPSARLYGIGQAMFAAISEEFRRAGVTKMRTMVARDNQLTSLFFRGEGMMAGPYLQLEKEL